MVNVSIIGLGGMGRTHFACYRRNAGARLVAMCSGDERKRRGEWNAQALNIGSNAAARVDLEGVAAYSDWRELIADPAVQLVDICLPTPQHATVAIAALQAGKHVLCEKPLALHEQDAARMAQAARAARRQLFVGHCLRFWPQYVAAGAILQSGDWGAPRFARLHRSSALPDWSAGDWLLDAGQSGGVVLDMHIHDVDCALWWFGEPQTVRAEGLVRDGLPLLVESLWHFEGGPLVSLHGAWDANPRPFRMGFELILERATLVFDTACGEDLLLHAHNETRVIPVAPGDGYQAQLDDCIACIAEGRAASRVTVESSRRALHWACETWRQLGG